MRSLKLTILALAIIALSTISLSAQLMMPTSQGENSQIAEEQTETGQIVGKGNKTYFNETSLLPNDTKIAFRYYKQEIDTNDFLAKHTEEKKTKFFVAHLETVVIGQRENNKLFGFFLDQSSVKRLDYNNYVFLTLRMMEKIIPAGQKIFVMVGGDDEQIIADSDEVVKSPVQYIYTMK